MKVSQEFEVIETRFSDLISKVRDTIRRRWLTLLLVAAAVFAAGVAIVFMITPQYAAVTRVRIDPSRSQLTNDSASAAMTLTPEAIETEVSSIESEDIATSVVRTLKLTDNPEFTKGFARTANQPLSTDARRAAIAGMLLRNLDVSRDKLTYILQIRYMSPDPVLAARVANSFAETYINTKIGSRNDTAMRKSAFIKQQLAQLAGEIQAAEVDVARYRAEAGIAATAPGQPGYSGPTVVDQQISPLSVQLAVAQSDAATAHAQLLAAEQQASRAGTDSVSSVLNSAVVSDLRRQRAEVLRAMGEVQARYGEKHPESIKVRDQLAAIDSQIRDEIGRVLASLRSSAAAADARVASLQGSMNRLADEQARNTRKAVLADSMEREAAAKRTQYEKLSQLAVDNAQAAGTTISQAEIVDRATPPSAPTFPNKPLLIGLALIVALAAGVAVIAVQELMVTGLRTADEIENSLGMQLLAAVPRVNKKHPAELLLDKPTSAFAEAFRITRASILGVRAHQAPQVIAFTSALPGEGKTTSSLAFARTLAINGARTLLVEADVRRAVMRDAAQDPSEGPGIVEILHGEATLADAITPGRPNGLDQLFVSQPYFSNENLFGDGKMERMLQELRRHYTHIVLDLPPLLGLADGRFLAAMADAVALIVRWDETPTQAVKSAVAMLQADEAKVVGALFTVVDTGAEGAGAHYYSKKYAGYYQHA